MYTGKYLKDTELTLNNINLREQTLPKEEFLGTD